jgi:hypothetical protein
LRSGGGGRQSKRGKTNNKNLQTSFHTALLYWLIALDELAEGKRFLHQKTCGVALLKVRSWKRGFVNRLSAGCQKMAK